MSESPQPYPKYTVSPAVRRAWSAGLLVILAALCTTAAPAGAQTATIAVVNDPDGVNVRGGPGTNYPTLGVAPKGSELPVLGARLNERWIPVGYRGQFGFVYDEFIEVRAISGPAAQPSPSPTTAPGTLPLPVTPTAAPAPPPAAAGPAMLPFQQLRVTSPDGVNLRAGPGMDQRVLTVVPVNTRVTVTGRSPDGRWVQVTVNGQTGWIDSEYLAPVTPGDDSRPANSADTGPSNGRYVWPVAGRSVTTNFSGGHPGIDVDQFPAGGNPVVAVAAGKVTFAGGSACCSYGLHVKVTHADGMVTLYAHLMSIDVREGQDVPQGFVLGRSGNSGFSTGAHLHFEMHAPGGPVDPLGQLPR